MDRDTLAQIITLIRKEFDKVVQSIEKSNKTSQEAILSLRKEDRTGEVVNAINNLDKEEKDDSEQLELLEKIDESINNIENQVNVEAPNIELDTKAIEKGISQLSLDIKAIKFPSIPEGVDNRDVLLAIAERKTDLSKLENLLKEIKDKQLLVNIPSEMDVNLNPNLIEDDFVKVRQDQKQVNQMSQLVEQGGANGANIVNGAAKTQLVDENGDNFDADNPLPVRETAFISTGNTTTTALPADTGGSDHIFTGTAEEVLQFGTVTLAVYSDVVSATGGICVENSSDGITWFPGDAYSYISPNTDKTYSFQATRKYWRVVYTNGTVAQTTFDLQVQVKPGYVKPSSHRLGDLLSLEDDAELVKANLIAKSDLTDLLENITSYRGSLNVNNSWVNRKIVNESFHEHDSAVTNPTTGITAGDTAVTADSVVGFSVGDVVKIEEDVAGLGIQEIGVLTITIIAGSVITFDRPISNNYTTAATIERVVTNMAVNGSLASPVIFQIDPPLGTVWQFTRILFNITDQTAMDDAKFGGITALTNGVSLRATTAAGRTVTFANWKSNSDMKLDMFDVDYSTKAPSGFFGLTGRWTFTKAEVVAELDGDASPIQQLEVLIQDDLTGLDTFTMRGQGRVFSPE